MDEINIVHRTDAGLGHVRPIRGLGIVRGRPRKIHKRLLDNGSDESFFRHTFGRQGKTVFPARAGRHEHHEDATHGQENLPHASTSEWRPTPPTEGSSQTSSSANTHDEGFARDVERADLGMRPPERPGHESPSSAAMFPHAQVKIFDGEFHNVAHIYESDPQAPGGGASALQFAGLASLQVASIATHHLHCNHPQVAPPPVMASPSTVYIALHFPSLYREMKIMITPLTLWLFIRMWIQRRAIERH